MEELLTERIIAESTCDNLFFGGGNQHQHQIIKTPSPTTNRSLLKQISSKLLQTSSSKTVNHESQTNQFNSTNSSTSANRASPNSTVTISSSSSMSTGSTSSLNSSMSINSTCSNQSNISSTDKKITSTTTVQTINGHTKCDQVDIQKSNSSSNNCSIKLNESQSSDDCNCQSNGDQQNQQISSSFKTNLDSKSFNQTVSTQNTVSNSSTSTGQSNQTNQTTSTVNQFTMTNCNKCLVKFTVFRRKHQCTKCSKPFCSNCLTAQKIKENLKLCSSCSINAFRKTLDKMEELLTERIIAESTCDNLFFGGGNQHQHQIIKTPSPTTNRSLLKQISSKLLQTSSSKTVNHESQTNQFNSTNSSTSANRASPNSTVTISSSSSMSTGSTSSLNSSMSINSTCSNQSNISSTDKKITSTTTVQTINGHTKCDQVDIQKSNSSSNNCSIKLNESQSSDDCNCQSNGDQQNQQISSSFKTNLDSKSFNQTVSTQNTVSNSSTSTGQSNQTNQTTSTVNQFTMTNCNKCLVKFTVFRRKHQCTKCSKPFCSNCLTAQKIKENLKLCSSCSINEQQSKQSKLDLVIDASTNDKRGDGIEILNSKNAKFNPLNETKEDNPKQQQSGEQIITQTDLKEQQTTLNNQINNIQLNSNLSINTASTTNLNSSSDIDHSIINSNINTVNTTTSSTTSNTVTKNDFVIISVLKKQGVNKNDTTTTTKRVCFSPEVKVFPYGIRSNDQVTVEQQRSTLLPSLITVNSLNANLNANLMANLTATSQIPSSRTLTFKPFLAHSQLTYAAQKGLILNRTDPTSIVPRRSSKRHHLSNSHRQNALTQQKFIQFSATSGLRNTNAAYNMLTKGNQTSSNKHLLTNSIGRSSNTNRKQLVYLTNGKLVNSYANYNDMFQNEKLFTSYVILA